MQPLRLSHLILLRFPEEQLAKMSSDEKYFQICGWEFWAEKAKLDFGVPIDYFNLPRNEFKLYFPHIDGYQRYLHILSKFSFRPEFLLRYEGKQILGFYDPFKVIFESLRQNNSEAVEFCLLKMSPEQISTLKELLYRFLPDPFRFKALNYLLDKLFQGCPGELFANARRYHKSTNGVEFFLQQHGENKLAEEKRDEELLEEFRRIEHLPGHSNSIYLSICKRIEEGSWLFEEIFAMIEKGQIEQNKVILAFESVIRSGNIEKVEKFFHLHATLHIPPGLTKVKSVVSSVPFDPSRTSEQTTTEYDHQRFQIPKGKFHFVPIQSITNNHIRKYLRKAAYSCNPLLFDFFLSLGPISFHDRTFSHSLFRSLANGYASNRERFVGAFEISQRLNQEFFLSSDKFDDEIFCNKIRNCSDLLRLRRIRVVSFGSIFSVNSVAIRTHQLTQNLVFTIKLEREEERKFKQNYPISFQILQSYIKVEIVD